MVKTIILIFLVYIPLILKTQNSIDTRLDVPLITQTTANCWEASLAMVVSWRQNASVVPEAILPNSAFLNQWCVAGLDLDHEEIFRYYGLMIDRNFTSYSPSDYERILRERGPIWVVIDVSSEIDNVDLDSVDRDIAPHAIVITGISGDGSLDGTNIYFNNPWGTSGECSFEHFLKVYFEPLIRYSGRLNKPTYFVYP